MRQLLFALLLLAGRSGTAQPTTSLAPQPFLSRWTVGGQLAYYPRIALTEAATGPPGTTYVRPWPAMLTLRYRVAPRAAYEVGLLLRITPAQLVTQSVPQGNYATTTRATTWALPLLMRLQVASWQPRRWQLDAEFGAMPLSTMYSGETIFANSQNGQYSQVSSSRQSYSDFPLLVGLGGTYALTPRLNLTADARLSWSFLLTVLGQALTHWDDYVADVMPAFSAGVSYQLGARQP